MAPMRGFPAVLVVLSALAVAACNGGGQPAPTPTATPAPSPTTVPTAERVVYADSSALVKLVVREQWSIDLARFLNGEADRLVSSALAEVEVVRGVRVAEAGVEGEEEALGMLDEYLSVVEVVPGKSEMLD